MSSASSDTAACAATPARPPESDAAANVATAMAATVTKMDLVVMRRSTLSTDNLKVRGKVFLGVLQDLDDRLTIGERQRRTVARAALVAGQHRPHPPVDRIFRRRRQRVERGRVDQVAARILHDPAREIELVQRAALAVARARRGKTLHELR